MARIESSTDLRLIEEVARLWLAEGGDAEGFQLCCRRVTDRIAEIEMVKATEGCLEGDHA